MLHILLFALALITAPASQAQPTQTILPAPVHALSPSTFKSGNQVYRIWGIQTPPHTKANVTHASRNALSRLIAGEQLTCFAHTSKILQCFNSKGTDIGKALISKGYATVDRKTVIGTPAQEGYTDAESDARKHERELWAPSTNIGEKLKTVQSTFTPLLYLAIAGSVVTILLCLSLLWRAIRDFNALHFVFNQTLKTLNKEAQVRQRELELAAVMIQSEIATNQSKIDAFLIIYQDLLNTLKDPDGDHRYKKSGEIVRSAPALDRHIYDSHRHRLDGLGPDLIPPIIDLYSQIETNPAYCNLEPDTDHSAAINRVAEVVIRAENLKLAIDTIQDISNSLSLKANQFGLSAKN